MTPPAAGAPAGSGPPGRDGERRVRRSGRLALAVLVIALLAAMGVLSRLWPEGRLLPPPWQFIGLVPLMAGLMIPLAVNRRLRRIDETRDREPDVLIADGIFGHSRNPVCLGFALLLLGAALIFNVAAALLPVVVYVVVADIWAIRPEEQRMARRFGAEYAAYRRRVRRWI